MRHYHFLAEGIPDIADELAIRNIGLVLRAYPNHSLLKFCDEIKPAIVIGDENPMREPEQWRVTVAEKVRVPLWTVDANVIVPSKLLLKEQFAARTIRLRIHALLPRFMAQQKNLTPHVAWRSPKGLQSISSTTNFISGWKLNGAVQPISMWRAAANKRCTCSENSRGADLRTTPKPATILN